MLSIDLEAKKNRHSLMTSSSERNNPILTILFTVGIRIAMIPQANINLAKIY